MRYLALCCALGVVGITACHSDDKPDPVTEYQLGTKTTYAPQQKLGTYQQAPQGYELVYSELVSRHGSRALSSFKYDDISMQVWREAQKQGALTPLGEKLGAEIERMTAANEALGYGNLSGLGHDELVAIGQRAAQRNQSLIDQATENQRHIVVEYSGKDRALASANAFTEGLTENNQDLADLLLAPKVNKAQLYFHKENKEYNDYVDNDAALRAAIDRLFDSDKSHQVAQAVLERLYSPEFVQQLVNGELKFYSTEEPDELLAENEVDVVIHLFNLYLIAPGMVQEAGEESWNFEQFFTPEETQWLSYVLDGEDFYEKGPSFNNTDITYKMASVLVDDFFNEIEKIKQGNDQAALKVRFAHAETIMPFAANMELKGSEEGVDPQTTFSYDNNDWHGKWVAPYSSNIQWDVYRGEADDLLVKMLYNEKEINFKSSCHPIEPDSYFYSFSELKRCYNQ
ncbi:histidine-type phosphatase [Photobacterium leiognathi]|uniref:histidine-type phosphatase n=1 Tax=Photobacterium leiognathi TaxID=553611 RepID=UPI00298257BF|nr:histidine-type phosphatase [Photobacterium leiognathi]